MPKTFIVDIDYQDTRFDKWFKNKVLDLPHSLIEKIIRLNKVKVNKMKTKSSYRVQNGDKVDVYELDKLKPQLKNKKYRYKPNHKELISYTHDVIENNKNFIIINKPAGIPVQSGTKSFKNIIDILKDTKYFLNSKPFIVHRIDKDTSGILIIAKNRKYAQFFTTLFRIKKIHKSYLAITHGKILKTKETLKEDLIYYEKKKKITQKALTHLNLIKSNNLYSLVELKPITGRKHQIRRHLLNLGNPIVGDNKYFLPKFGNLKFKDLMLHAYKIKFILNNVKYNFKAKYNEKFETFLKKNF